MWRFAFVVLLLVGCTTKDPSSTSPPSLAGTWKATALRPADLEPNSQAEHNYNFSASMAEMTFLHLMEDGSFKIDAVGHEFVGRWHASGSNLTLDAETFAGKPIDHERMERAGLRFWAISPDGTELRPTAEPGERTLLLFQKLDPG